MRYCCRLTCLLVLASLHQIVLAEEVVPPEDDPSVQNNVEQTTNVQQRSTSLHLTPHSVTVIDEEEINVTYRRDLEDLELLIPGLIIDSLSSIPNGAAIAVRGTGSGNTEKSIDPAVAILIDGVYVGTHQGQNQLLFDVEKVEVIRGPQSVYRGPTGFSGTINLTRSKPTGKTGGKFRITSTAHNRDESEFVINFPVFSQLAIKFAGHMIEGDGGYMKNTAWKQRSENEDDHATGTVSALWKFGEKDSLQYTFDGEWDKSDTPGLLNISTSEDILCATLGHCGSDINAAVPETLSLDRISQEFSNNLELDGYYQTLTLNMDLKQFTLTNITSRRMTNEVVNQDLDATSLSFFSRTKAQNYHQFSNDLRFLSPADDNFQYLAGYYYQEDRYRLAQSDHYILDWLGILDTYVSGDPPPTPSIVRLLTSKQSNKTHALYSHFDFRLDERSSLDFGVRYTIRTNDFAHTPNTLLTDGIISSPGTFIRKDEEWDKLTGTLGFTYDVDKSSMLFIRYSDGYRGGGYSDQAGSNNSAIAFQPERMETYEVGIKTLSRDGNLSFNVTAYQSKWDEKLETFLTPVKSGQIESVIGTASKVNINGWEVELRALFMDQLTLRTTYSHINADYDVYAIPDIELTADDPFADLSTYSPERAPADTLYISTNYVLPLSTGRLSFYLAYRYTTDYQTNSLINQAWVHNYGITDISLDYIWNNWTFRFIRTNLRNKRFIRNAANLTDASVVPLDSGTTTPRHLSTSTEYNLPRYSGLEIRYTFGR